MPSDNVRLLSTNVPTAVQFDATKQFHTHTAQQEMDSAFLGYRRRPWVREKPKRDTRKEREIMAALLASDTNNYAADCVNKLISEDISFRDLASLTSEDLELIGFASRKHRNESIDMFSMMPNQDPSYDYICSQPESNSYNNEIVGNAASHLMSMRSSLAATNYKLQMLPPEDVIVGDKRYASRFALEALNSVRLITNELAKDLHKLEEMAKQMQQADKSAPKEKKSSYCRTFLYYTAIAIGAACAWLWWSNRRLGIQRISV